MINNINTDAFSDRTRLKELRVAHRDLDVVITKLSMRPDADLQVRQLKKHKLHLKDMIIKMEGEMLTELTVN